MSNSQSVSCLLQTGFRAVTSFFATVILLLAGNGALAADPNQGPGGPVLVITAADSTFGKFYAEILRTEGLNSFAVADLSTVTASTLANYDVAILARTRQLSATQVTALTDWVTAGGNLIAMDPDPQLAGLLGISPAGTTQSNGYLLVNTSTRPGNGIINTTLQYHGSASLFSLGSATRLATLYSSSTSSTSYPAVTLRDVGLNGGQAAAFAFDLATSIVQTRQGNPAWAGQKRDGQIDPIRSDDLFFGGAQPDWIDLSKVGIPQADEQQRFFANLITYMSLDRKPLPRFWYFPTTTQTFPVTPAVVLMTADDHGQTGPTDLFNRLNANSPAGCSVTDWTCMRGTTYQSAGSYGTTLTNTAAASFTSQGFEVALHLNTGCANFTPASLAQNWSDQLAAFAQAFPSVSLPLTNRNHCIAWSDWASSAKVELANGVRFDTNYYFWPPGWVNDTPGHFTGSAMPMRFADLNGALIDVYQAVTQMTDESGQTYPYTIDTLLDRALGPDEQYGVYTVNAHTDSAPNSVSDAVIASAKSRGVPVVSARQMLTWLDARNASSFGSLAYGGNSLTFTVLPGAGAAGLRALVPYRSTTGLLSAIKRGTTDVSYLVTTIKGVDYAAFPAVSGSYTATYVADSMSPVVISQYPVNGATGVDAATPVAATFSESMDPSTINSSTFELRDASNSIVPATIGYDSYSKTATLLPNSMLTGSTTYTATVRGGLTEPTAKDLSGNPLGANSTWSFTVAGQSGGGCPCSGWTPSTVPTTASANDSAAVELGVKFRSTVGGYVTGIRFYKGATNTGAHVGNLWTSSGTLLATGTFSSESASGWQTLTLASPVAISANTVYVASYFAPNGRYAVDEGYFATTGRTAGPLYFLRDGESGGNGVYRYGSASGFPSQSFNSSNYWVDVVFSTSTPLDTTSPTLLSRTPAVGATGVLAGSPVTATFSEALDPTTVGSSTFELRDAGNNLVPAAISYDAANSTITLTPSAALAASTTYTATLRGGSTDPRVKDLAGNAYSGTPSWTFTTAAAQSDGCPCSVFDATATPAVLADSDASSVELGVKFRTDVAGYITGVRFYKGSTNGGTHTGSLWTSGGTRLATATFTNETSSGWQQVTFASPVAIAANTVYVASYFAPQGHYSANSGYFASAGADRGVLHLLQDGVNGGNGVYAYSSTSAFPSATYQSTNYWVDVVFVSNTGPDTTAPAVVSLSPTSGATGVAVNSTVAATFSEALDATTVNASTVDFRVTGSATATGATVGYNASSSTVTITPTAALAASTSYTVTLRGGATDPRIKDLAGNALATNVTWTFTTGAATNCSANPIVAENCLTGNPASEWDVSGAGDSSIQGFATDISVNRGSTISFKVSTNASAYRIDIYRLGYYGGLGARKITTVSPSASLPQSQPNCLSDSTTGLIDCGNWAVSASWAVPSTATSGIYIAKLVRSDTGGASHMIFIVRDDASTSDLLFQTSDTTWQAYNQWGGNSLYTGSPAGRAYKVSYNRPFNTRSVDGGQDWVFNAEYPMVRWLEANGFDVSYTTGVDSDRRGNLIRNHKVFMSVGHDEYWSGGQRTNVEAARDAGVNLAFFSGNEVFWKTRWENSIDGSATPNRTLVSYKETHANAKIDPLPNVWTGTWRDPRYSPPADGGRPENALTGTIFMVNDCGAACTTSIDVPEADGKMRFWRNTSIANLASGATASLPSGVLGYEWDVDAENGFRPAGLIRLATTTRNGMSVLQDYGSTYASGTATHALTLYKAPSGALVFGAGTVQWTWGLDANHDRDVVAVDSRMRQATVNLLADMSAQPATLQAGLALAAKSTDATAPTSVVTYPAAGATLAQGATVTISGTAADAGGGVVGGMEISVDGGATWRRANGRSTWTYSWTPTAVGSVTIKTRAADDSGNLEAPGSGTVVTVSNSQTCPCTIWDASAAPGVPVDNDPNSVELGVKFRSDSAGYITGIRFYKGVGNGGTHTGSLWSSTGTRLATATFTNETASGWQQVNFATPVAITANTVYVASYFAPQGLYFGEDGYFTTKGVDRGVLHALQDGVSGGNGVYGYGTTSNFPTNTYRSENYWVDVVFDTSIGNTPPVVATPPSQSGLVGSSVSLQVVASDANGDSLTYSATGLPAGLSISPTTGLISGVLSTAATSTVTVTVNDGRGGTASAAFTWTVVASGNLPPTVSNPGSQASVVNSSVSLQIQATDPNSDPLTYTASGLPAGLSIGATSGLISGIVTTAGSTNVTVTVDDGNGGIVPTSFNWVVSVANTAPTVVNPGSRTGTVGTAFSLQISASDPDVGDVLTYSASGLPSPLAINSATGLISGTPTAASTSTVTVTVSDGKGGTGTAIFSLTISPAPNAAPVVTNPGNQSTVVGQSVSLQIVATDANNDPLTFTSSGRPAGVSMNSAGLFSGRPTTVGVYTVTVTANDGKGGTGSATFTWTVSADVTAPTQPTLSAPTLVSGNPRLSWTASTDNVAVTGYRIYRSMDGSLGPQVATTAAGTRTWTDTAVTEGQSYTYAVAAFDAAGNVSTPSVLRTITAGAAPSTPSGLAATTSGGKVSLTWNASTDNVAVVGYIISRSTSNTIGTEIGRSTTPSYVDSAVTVGTRYYYQVRAYDAANYISGYSSRVNIIAR